MEKNVSKCRKLMIRMNMNTEINVTFLFQSHSFFIIKRSFASYKLKSSIKAEGKERMVPEVED